MPRKGGGRSRGGGGGIWIWIWIWMSMLRHIGCRRGCQPSRAPGWLDPLLALMAPMVVLIACRRSRRVRINSFSVHCQRNIHRNKKFHAR